jgi:lipid-A-disaccharide synthase
MVAGESSGDLLAGLMMDGLKTQWPDVAAFGIGGPQMTARGFEPWWPSSRLAVRGYVEVLQHYWGLVRIRKALIKRLLKDRPDVFIGIDAPDFNLHLEAKLKSQGVRTVHFVCPSVWAWRPKRLQRIKQCVDRMLCIFPFEVELLTQHGIAATYVGHPLADFIPMVPDRAKARRTLGLDQSQTVVALLPGSRATEIQYLASRFINAAEKILQQQPDTHFVLPCAVGMREALVRVLAQLSHMQPRLKSAIQLLPGQSHVALEACDVTLTASGTATLEAALFKKPMVIAYAMNPISWRLMNGQRLQPWVGLPNILAREFLVPELLQDAATPSRLANEVLMWLHDPERVHNVQAAFQTMHHALRRDTPELCAYAIDEVLAG